ncbi:hypothetical protein BVY03_02310 [bacterium K02(2017)]|nr:hypothetical protein BVY03_02310 [bacterium K02(2017)]
MTDEELMELYQLGDSKGFRELYARYHPKITGYLIKRCPAKSQLVEDILQQIFMKFHRLRQSYNPKYPVSAWLFTITRSCLIDEMRKVKKDQNVATLETVKEQSSRIPEPNINIPLESLNKAEKNIIQQRFFNEETYEDISNKLGISTQSVRKRVSRAIKKLRTHLKGKQHES